MVHHFGQVSVGGDVLLWGALRRGAILVEEIVGAEFLRVERD
jgi:hypothetical protein